MKCEECKLLSSSFWIWISRVEKFKKLKLIKKTSTHTHRRKLRIKKNPNRKTSNYRECTLSPTQIFKKSTKFLYKSQKTGSQPSFTLFFFFFLYSFTTEPSPLYENSSYHEECLRCNSCGLNLTGPNQKRARRFKVCTVKRGN